MLLLLVAAPPASAHGVAGTRSANIASAVTGLVDPEAPGAVSGRASALPEVDGLEWRVLGGDAYLQLENRSPSVTVTVLGYQLEPYLRIGPDGVEENVRSPATYLNADRYARVRLPPEADARAEPRWRRVADEPSWAWRDHRMQWMGASDPPPAAAAPGQEHLLAEWTVPLEIDGRSAGLAGTLRWVPPSPAWVPLAVAAGLLLGTVALLWRAGGTGRPARLLLALVGVAALVAVDELAAAPVAPVAERLAASGPSASLVALALLGAVLARRDGPRGALGAILAGLALLAYGVAESGALTASQVVTLLPPPLTRLLVALALAAPLASLAVLSARRQRR